MLPRREVLDARSGVLVDDGPERVGEVVGRVQDGQLEFRDERRDDRPSAYLPGQGGSTFRVTLPLQLRRWADAAWGLLRFILS